MSKEVYETLKGAPKYSISNYGNILSHQKNNDKVLKPQKMGEYLGVQIVFDDIGLKKEYIHRLVAKQWIGINNGEYVRHLNGDKHNNQLSNISVGTASDNEQDKLMHGTSPKGENNPMAKLTIDKVISMRNMREFTNLSFSRIASEFNVSTMTAYRAITKRSWA